MAYCNLNKLASLILTISGLTLACGPSDSPGRSRSVPEVPSDRDDLSKPEPGGRAEQSSLDSTIYKDPSLHYILIHGGGPNMFVKMDGLKAGLTKQGIDGNHIHLLTYQHDQPLSTIVEHLGGQMQTLLSSLPDETRLDVIGHSLGDFIGIYTIAKSGVSSSVRKYIALAGVKNGQNSKPITCLFGCGDVYDFIVPFQNQKLMSFYQEYHLPLSRIEHCSLDSATDIMVTNPRYAGRFQNGSHHLVPRFGHLDFAKEDGAALIIEHCY